ANRDSWSIQHDGEVFKFSPTSDEYRTVGIAMNRAFNETDLLRFLISRFGPEKFMLDDEALLKRFPRCPKMQRLIQTLEGHHPDVSGGEKPSETMSIRTLLHAIAEHDPALFSAGVPNTSWKSWTDDR